MCRPGHGLGPALSCVPRGEQIGFIKCDREEGNHLFLMFLWNICVYVCVQMIDSFIDIQLFLLLLENRGFQLVIQNSC